MKRAAAIAIAIFFVAPAAHAEVFGLSISVAHKNGVPVRDDAWIAAHIARANELFAPSGVAFRWTLRKSLPERLTEIHTKDDRDALGSFTEHGGVIDLFVVDALEDVDQEGRMLRGVCWTQRTDKQRYVTISSIAMLGVLGHELGHFFGNPHTPVPDNLMSYVRAGGTVAFDDVQIDRIRSFSGHFVSSKRLVDVGVPRFFP